MTTPDTTAAVEAGRAGAVADDAHEMAAEAQHDAEVAEEIAEHAAEAAWAARSDVEALREEMAAGFAALALQVEELRETHVPAPTEDAEDDTPPAPKKTSKPKATPEGKPKRERGWFAR